MKKHLVSPLSFGLVAAVFAAVVVSVVNGGSRAEKIDHYHKAREVVATMFPDGRITEVKAERRIVELVEVAVIVDGVEKEILLTTTGEVLEFEQEVSLQDLPAAAREAIEEIGRKRKIEEIERRETFCELKWVPLESPRVDYTAEFRMRGKDKEVTVSGTGQVSE